MLHVFMKWNCCFCASRWKRTNIANKNKDLAKYKLKVLTKQIQNWIYGYKHIDIQNE